MRPETKARIDAFERRERRRRFAFLLAVAMLVAGSAYAYTRPSEEIGIITATVVRSEVGIDHWGQSFHHLTARLAGGAIVNVGTLLNDEPLGVATPVQLSKIRGAWGNTYYRLHVRPGRPEQLK